MGMPLNMILDQRLAAAADQDFSKFMGLVNQKNAMLSPTESPQACGGEELFTFFSFPKSQ